MTAYRIYYSLNGSPGEIRTPVSGSKARYACPLHHRAAVKTDSYSEATYISFIILAFIVFFFFWMGRSRIGAMEFECKLFPKDYFEY